MGFLGKERIKEVDKKDNVSAKDIRKFCEESSSVDSS